MPYCAVLQVPWRSRWRRCPSEAHAPTWFGTHAANGDDDGVASRAAAAAAADSAGRTPRMTAIAEPVPAPLPSSVRSKLLPDDHPPIRVQVPHTLSRTLTLTLTRRPYLHPPIRVQVPHALSRTQLRIEHPHTTRQRSSN
jgi:hypothetical protein